MVMVLILVIIVMILGIIPSREKAPAPGLQAECRGIIFDHEAGEPDLMAGISYYI